MKTGRPALQSSTGHLRQAQARCDRVSDRAEGGDRSNPDSSSLANFGTVHPEHRSGRQRRHPRAADSAGLGASSRLPVGLELDGPAGSDRRLIAIGLALEKVFGRLPAPPKR
jgi:hypothetical protein